MKYSPILFHSPLYRSFIIVLGKLLYEYRPNGVCHFLIIVRCIVCYMGSCRETSVELPTFTGEPSSMFKRQGGHLAVKYFFVTPFFISITANIVVRIISGSIYAPL